MIEKVLAKLELWLQSPESQLFGMAFCFRTFPAFSFIRNIKSSRVENQLAHPLCGVCYWQTWDEARDLLHFSFVNNFSDKGITLKTPALLSFHIGNLIIINLFLTSILLFHFPTDVAPKFLGKQAWILHPVETDVVLFHWVVLINVKCREAEDG